MATWAGTATPAGPGSLLLPRLGRSSSRLGCSTRLGQQLAPAPAPGWAAYPSRLGLSRARPGWAGRQRSPAGPASLRPAPRPASASRLGWQGSPGWASAISRQAFRLGRSPPVPAGPGSPPGRDSSSRPQAALCRLGRFRPAGPVSFISRLG
jgi:hypothetical protein